MDLPINKIIQGDCLEVLKTLPDKSIDLVLTDPPYELGFMGKEWDKTGIANNVEMWAECLRVLKPGGHLLSFGGTRTYHRMAVAIEDAGFEVRDMIEWVYGSGFPKSLNIGKAVDKLQGNEREEFVNTNGSATGSIVTTGTGSLKKEFIDSKGTSAWEGWGTALKPAHEPICMARKPLAEKTVAENCLKWGTGGINIDGCRVEAQGEDLKQLNSEWAREWNNDWLKQRHDQSPNYPGWKPRVGEQNSVSGRFPANLIHDNSEEVRECFPETKSGGGNKGNVKDGTGMFGNGKSFDTPTVEPDSGNASRFFKSIMTDSLCSICCLPYDVRRDTMSVCNNTNVSSAEKSLQTTQATTESTALKSATGQVNKNLVQNVKFAGNLCDLCGTSIAQRLVAIMQDPSQESTLGELSMPEHKKQILEKCLVSFVELRGNTDTIPTMENLSLLFGYVSNAIEEYTQKCEDTRNEEKSQWKSLVYRSKASKSERNKGCEKLEDRFRAGLAGADRDTDEPLDDVSERFRTQPAKNNHPTVKPIALMTYLIKMASRHGGIVLDPFAGSGTTCIAAKQENRNYIGIELSPEYCEIARKRVEQAIQYSLPLAA